MKCLLSDAMMAYVAPATPNVMSPPATPNSSNSSPLSSANASLLANSPAGSGDGAAIRGLYQRRKVLATRELSFQVYTGIESRYSALRTRWTKSPQFAP